MGDLLRILRDVLDIELFVIGGTQVRVSTLLTVLIVLTVTVWISRMLRLLVERTLTKRGARPGDIGISDWARLQQSARIGMARAGKDLFRGPAFDNLPQIHDSNGFT